MEEADEEERESERKKEGEKRKIGDPIARRRDQCESINASLVRFRTAVPSNLFSVNQFN